MADGKAFKISPGYVTDPTWRLMFLRASAYDSENAAQRCVKFMEEKNRLFGPGPLARRLFLSDLSDDDMVCLTSGALQVREVSKSSISHAFICPTDASFADLLLLISSLQVLPQRDTRGRAVVGNFRNLIPRSYKVVDNMVGSLRKIQKTRKIVFSL